MWGESKRDNMQQRSEAEIELATLPVDSIYTLDQ